MTCTKSIYMTKIMISVLHYLTSTKTLLQKPPQKTGCNLYSEMKHVLSKSGHSHHHNLIIPRDYVKISQEDTCD